MMAQSELAALCLKMSLACEAKVSQALLQGVFYFARIGCLRHCRMSKTCQNKQDLAKAVGSRQWPSQSASRQLDITVELRALIAPRT